MPPRFVRRRKKFARRRKRAYLRNRGAKSQALQLFRLSGKILRLENRLIDKSGFFHYYNAGTQEIPGIPGGSLQGYGYNTFRIHPVATSWRKCLDLANDAELDSDTWRLHKTQLQMRIEIGTETDSPIEFSVYVVKIKKDMRDLVYRNYGSNLTNIFSPDVTGTNTPDEQSFNPFNAFESGQVFINPNMFRVLKTWKFTLGQVGYGTSLTGPPGIRNMRDTVRNLTWTQRYGGKKGVKLQRSSEPIHDALVQDAALLNRTAWTHVLIISNNGVLDSGYPELKYTAVHHLSDPQ